MTTFEDRCVSHATVPFLLTGAAAHCAGYSGVSAFCFFVSAASIACACAVSYLKCVYGK
jgi:hypothetical protein